MGIRRINFPFLPPPPPGATSPDALSRSPEYASCANFVSVDVDEFDDVAASHSVVGVPVFVAYRGTKEHSRLQGSDKAELEAFLKAAAAF